MDTPYTYVFTRKDIPLHAQIVQSNHATLEMGLKLNEEKKPKQTSFLILLEAKDKNSLYNYKEFLEEHGIDHHMFYEPDYDMGHTAICTEPVYGDQKELFKKFKLWKHK